MVLTIGVLYILQHNQWIRSAVEGGTQAVSGEGSVAITQGESAVPLPCPARLLRGAVPREGRLVDGTGRAGFTKILAKDVLAEGGDVSWRNRRNIGRDRATAVR